MAPGPDRTEPYGVDPTGQTVDGRAVNSVEQARGHAARTARSGYGPVMDKEQVTTRLHDALHRGRHKATEEELAEVTAIVLAIVGELVAEVGVVMAELNARVEALEARA